MFSFEILTWAPSPLPEMLGIPSPGLCYPGPTYSPPSPHHRTAWGMCPQAPLPRARLSVNHGIRSEDQFTTEAVGSRGGEILPPVLICYPASRAGGCRLSVLYCALKDTPVNVSRTLCCGSWGGHSSATPSLVCSLAHIPSTVLGQGRRLPQPPPRLRHLVGFPVCALCPGGQGRRQEHSADAQSPKGLQEMWERAAQWEGPWQSGTKSSM